MQTSQEILSVATEICSVLEFLIPEQATSVKNEINLLLSKAHEEDIEDEINALLNTHDKTRSWLQRRLSHRTSTIGIRSFSSLPGDSSAITHARKYCCPTKGCKHTWFMHHLGQIVPSCPAHKQQLVEVSAT